MVKKVCQYFLTLISSYYFLLLFINFCIYFWLCWVFVAARRLSLVAASGGYSLLRCAGFSLRWLLVAEHKLQVRGPQQLCHAGFSSCGSRALQCRLSSCGTRAQLLHSMWDLPGPGLKPVSPALAGRFLTSAHQRSPDEQLLLTPVKLQISQLFGISESLIGNKK